MGGPSRRGFELMVTDPVEKPEKTSNQRLSLELSLRLPEVEMPFGFNNEVEPPGSPCHEKSVQSSRGSVCTNFERFPSLMPLSDSQNLSRISFCSATDNSSDREQSVESPCTFPLVDRQVRSLIEPDSGSVSNIQGPYAVRNNMNQKSQEYQGNLSNQSAVEKFRTVRGSFTKPVELDQYQLKVGAEFIELTLTLMVSEPLKVVAQKFVMMSEQEVVLLKDSVRDIISNSNRQWQLSYFQESLQSRSDITLEMLLKSHRTQLEILLAIKTGLQDFLQCNSDISSSNLGEIFLNMRCRNLVCRSLLPVDECNCRFCILNTGFCSACMCLICSKFDTSCNTCSWVGCDLCLHWYHAECALQESCIRNGRSFGGAESKTGMHLHCIACGHVSELFDFVKDVFIACLEDWTAGAVLRELNYVKEIFQPSEDFRGKRLHEIAIQLLSSLGNNVDVEEAKSHILGFLTAPDSFIEDDVQVDYFTEKYDMEGQKVKKMQLMEHKGMMKVFDKDEAKINQASFLSSSPSETETALLLERAKMLLQRNNEERNLQCLGLGDSMKAFDEDKAGNNRICFSSSSSSVCNYRKRKLF